MNYWQGKVAIVTGGSSGLGLILAETLAARGSKVVIASRGQERLESAVRLLSDQGLEVFQLRADVTKPEDVDRLIHDTMERFQSLHALVNCAGRSARGEILSTSPEDFAELLDINLLGTVRCTRAAAPHLLKTQGHIVNVGSLASRLATRYMGAYPASKFAVAAYSQQLRLELGPQGLHVLLACPGPVASDVAMDRYADQAEGLPAAAHRPGAGAKVKALDPRKVAGRILAGCEARRPELVMPATARVLFAASSISPRLGDWLLKKWT